MTHDEQKPEFIKCPYDTRCGNYLSNPSIARESELLAVIRAMDAALRYVEAHYDGMEKADIVSKAIRLAEQVV